MVLPFLAERRRTDRFCSSTRLHCPSTPRTRPRKPPREAGLYSRGSVTVTITMMALGAGAGRAAPGCQPAPLSACRPWISSFPPWRIRPRHANRSRSRTASSRWSPEPSLRSAAADFRRATSPGERARQKTELELVERIERAPAMLNRAAAGVRPGLRCLAARSARRCRRACAKRPPASALAACPPRRP